MSWKRQNKPKQKESNMIEHSISKYEPINPPVVVYEKHGGMQHWPQEQCVAYIEALKKRGYTQGTHVKSKWGVDGYIEPYIPVPHNGLSFYGKATPDVIKIKLGNYGNCMSYNEDELTITTPTEWEQLC
jgi:hypothetical protein